MVFTSKLLVKMLVFSSSVYTIVSIPSLMTIPAIIIFISYIIDYIIYPKTLVKTVFIVLA